MRIYHTSDLHDRRDFAQPLEGMRRQAPGYYFDCGDSLRGSQTVYYRKEPIIAELDAAGCDAQALGNREFHYLFGRVAARAAKMRHPLVCSNLLDRKGRTLPFARALKFSLGEGEQRSAMHVLGLLVTQYPRGSVWERLFGWEFVPPAQALAEYAPQVGTDDLLVVCSHLGLKADRDLARAAPRIDLLLGGHSHDTLPAPEIVADVPIVHAGPYGKYVSRSELEFEGGRWHLRECGLVPLRP